MNNFPIPFHQTWEVTDPSKLNDFITCPRYYFFRHLLGWRGEMPNNHLVFGQAWHVAMEYLLKHGYEPVTVLVAGRLLEEEYRKVFPEETDDLFGPKTPFRALLALNEYATLYARDLDETETLFTEQHGAVPVNDHQTLFYRIDSILRDKKYGFVFSREHKTGTSLNNQWMMQWPLSIQIGSYCHALYCLFDVKDVQGVEISGTFFKKTKAPLFDFKRLQCWKTPRQMRMWFANMGRHLLSLEREFDLLNDESDSDEVMLSFYQNPISCNNYFGCEFHDYCCTWNNPLRNADEPPLGFVQEFWDPRDEAVGEAIEIKPLDIIDEMLKELTNG